MTDRSSAALRSLADYVDIQVKGLLALADGLRTLADTPDETRLNLSMAARELGVSPGFIRKAIKRGDVRAERLGKKCWRVSRGELDRLRKLRATA